MDVSGHKWMQAPAAALVASRRRPRGSDGASNPAEIERARYEVEQLSARLAVAKERLKAVEKGRREAPAAGRKDDPSYKTTVTRPYVAKGSIDYVPAKVKPEDAKAGNDPDARDRRIDQLEQKLDQLLSEMREVKKRKEKE